MKPLRPLPQRDKRFRHPDKGGDRGEKRLCYGLQVLALARQALEKYKEIYLRLGMFPVHCAIHAEKINLDASVKGASLEREPRYVLVLPDGRVVVSRLGALSSAPSMGSEWKPLPTERESQSSAAQANSPLLNGSCTAVAAVLSQVAVVGI